MNFLTVTSMAVERTIRSDNLKDSQKTSQIHVKIAGIARYVELCQAVFLIYMP